MIAILKIAVAAAIAFGVLSPSFSPKADNASCNCNANA
jgi:hypothetical protein